MMPHNDFRYFFLCLSGLTWLGCSENYRPDSATKTTDQTQNATHKGPADPVIAQVNGQPILQSELLNILLPGPGRNVLDELILFHVIQQHAKTRGVTLTDPMIRNQRQRILDDMAPGKTPSQQASLLNYMLQSRGLSEVQFDLIVRRQALLRELVDPNVDITDSMLEDEYQRLHGKQIEIRLLAAGSARKIEAAKRRFEQGEDFLQLVRDLSEDQPSLSRDGLMGPFSKTDPHIPENIRNAAFALESSGQYSELIQYVDRDGIEYYGWFRIEKILPEDFTAYDQVREDLKHSLHQKNILERMNALQQQMKTKANIIILEPSLVPRRRTAP